MVAISAIGKNENFACQGGGYCGDYSSDCLHGVGRGGDGAPPGEVSILWARQTLKFLRRFENEQYRKYEEGALDFDTLQAAADRKELTEHALRSLYKQMRFGGVYLYIASYKLYDNPGKYRLIAILLKKSNILKSVVVLGYYFGSVQESTQQTGLQEIRDRKLKREIRDGYYGNCQLLCKRRVTTKAFERSNLMTSNQNGSEVFVERIVVATKNKVAIVGKITASIAAISTGLYALKDTITAILKDILHKLP